MENSVSHDPAGLFLRVNDALRYWSQHSADHPALVEAQRRYTYRDLEEAVSHCAAWLPSVGVRPGDRVVIVAENCAAFVVLFFALTQFRALPVPLNAHLSARELEEIEQHCGARLVIYVGLTSPSTLQHAKRNAAIFEDTPFLGAIGRTPTEETVAPEPSDVAPGEDVAAIVYTSGTTGKPKGVMLTHRNLLFAARVSSKIRSFTTSDRLLGVLPMSHATGLSMQLLGTLVRGATLHLLPRFDPIQVRSVLQNDGITVVYGVPFLFTQFLDYAKLRGLNSLRFPQLRVISSSGSPLLTEIKRAVEDLFGLVLQNGYGVSECSPGIAATPLEAPRRDNSVGRIYPEVEVKLVGPDNHEVAEGEVGEVRVRGPNVMKGYYRAPEETAKAIDAEGWFNTRDLGRMENDFLYIVGRTKEMIIRYGFNVYPAEVEGVLNAHPGVARSAVIGRTMERTGEQEVMAFVQLTPESNVTAAELSKHAAEHLAPYKLPTQIHFVSGMPMNALGKILKDQLARNLVAQSVPTSGKN
jgi:acyl-CoA synthetase (AMP-forming)/AMP-acid ligase II